MMEARRVRRGANAGRYRDVFANDFVRTRRLVSAVVVVTATLAGCGDDSTGKVAARPSTTHSSIPDSTTGASSSTSSSTASTEPAPTTSSTATTAASSNTSSTEAPAGPSAAADHKALGARLTLRSTAGSVGPADSAQFDLVIENRSSKYLTYDSNVDFIALYAGDQHSWSPSCGYARPAVVLYASIPPGESHHVRPEYPSANDDYSSSCRVAPGDYELRGTFRACQSDEAFDDQRPKSSCDATQLAVVSLAFHQG